MDVVQVLLAQVQFGLELFQKEQVVMLLLLTTVQELELQVIVLILVQQLLQGVEFLEDVVLHDFVSLEG